MRKLNLTLLEPETLAACLNTTCRADINHYATQLYLIRQRIPHDRIVDSYVGAYPLISKWQGRATLIFDLARFARKHDKAYALAIQALADRSKLVAEHACMAIAASGRKRCRAHIIPLLNHKHEDVRCAAEYALDKLNSGSRPQWID
jgi:hypothetical protein